VAAGNPNFKRRDFPQIAERLPTPADLTGMYSHINKLNKRNVDTQMSVMFNLSADPVCLLTPWSRYKFFDFIKRKKKELCTATAACQEAYSHVLEGRFIQ